MDEKIAVLTDTNSGINPDQAAQYGIHLVSMPVIIDDETYFENESISQDEFFQRLREGACVSTSQPAPGVLMDCWEGLLERYEEIVYLPMSSGLSGGCQTAAMLAAEYGGSVHVVDNHRISVTLRQSVLEAKHLASQGKTAQENRRVSGAGRIGSQYLCGSEHTGIPEKKAAELPLRARQSEPF